MLCLIYSGGYTMNYYEAKQKGYRFITRDYVGGETAHKTYPIQNSRGYWVSPEWQYITNGTGCLKTTEVVEIDTAIQNSKTPIKSHYKKKHYHSLTCAVCGKPFEAERKNRMYCSKKCSNDANNERVRRKKEQLVSYCIECGKPFVKVSKSNTCSTECSYKRKLKKNAESARRRNSVKT